MAKMYYVGKCRICEQGTLGLRTCGQCEAIAIVCDECDVAWDSPDLATQPTIANETTLPCPTCGESLYGGASHWTTQQEIDRRAWLQTALDSGQLQLESCEAREPEVK